MACSSPEPTQVHASNSTQRQSNATTPRFGNSNDGKMHWNGDASQGRGVVIPSAVEKRLTQLLKDGKAVASC